MKIVIPVVLLIAGCATNSGVLKLGPDTYTITTQNSPARGGTSGATRSALVAANKHCASLGKEILVTNTTSRTTNIHGAGEAAITFQCLDKDDPGLQRPSYKKPADVVIENK